VLWGLEARDASCYPIKAVRANTVAFCCHEQRQVLELLKISFDRQLRMEIDEVVRGECLVPAQSAIALAIHKPNQ
jgi:hypothetical protein